MDSLIPLIPFLPFIGFIINGLFGKKMSKNAVGIIGSGTVSNKSGDGGPGKTIAEGGAGYVCIAELRTVETIRAGKPSTQFMRFGDVIRIEMKDRRGHSIFGAIEQTVEKAD